MFYDYKYSLLNGATVHKMIYTKFKNFNDFIAEEEDSDFLQFDEVQFLVYQKLEELTEDELDELGYYIYTEYYDDCEDADDLTFGREDIDCMIAELGEYSEDLFDDLYEMLFEEDPETFDITEAVGRRFLAKNRKRKKNRRFKNGKTVAQKRREKILNKVKNRKTRAQRKRYYRKNKQKIASYMKSYNQAVKSGQQIKAKAVGAH